MPVLPLLAGKMKIASSIGVAGVSVISVPATLSVTSLKNSQDFFQPLTSVASKLHNQGKTKFEGMDTALQTEYVQFGEKIIGNAKEGASEIKDNIQTMSETAKGFAESAYEIKDEINYIAFEVGSMVKAVARHIPTIISDSIVEITQGAQGKNLLSLQKINDIVQSSKFTEFVASLVSVWAQHKSLISGMSYKDADGIIQIFKELDRGGIDTFLSKVKTNSENLDSNSSDYCNATKLMMHLLIGKTQINGVENEITTLKEKLEELKTELQKILGNDINIDDLKGQLDKISGSAPKIKDPCSGQ